MSERTSKSLDYIIPTGVRVWFKKIKIGIPFAIEILFLFTSFVIVIWQIATKKNIHLTSAKSIVILVHSNLLYFIFYIFLVIIIDSLFRGIGIKYCDEAIRDEESLKNGILNLKNSWPTLFFVELLFCFSIFTPLIYILKFFISNLNLIYLGTLSFVFVGWLILNVIIFMYLPISAVLGKGPPVNRVKIGILTLVKNFGQSIAILLAASALQFVLLLPLQILKTLNVYLAFLYMIFIIAFVVEPIFIIWRILIYRKTLNPSA